MPRRHRLLIASNDPADREQFKSYLANVRCDLEFADDGPDTLARIVSFRPEIVLLDELLPGGGGFGVCMQIKGNPKSEQTVVMMVLAPADLEDIERAVQSGVDDLISKPVNGAELVKRVENMLRFFKSR